jgi:hypothetical protein
MTTTPRPARRRARAGSPAAAAALARLTAAREQLDADAADRRRREDTLIQQYALASGDAADALTRRDTALAELDRQVRTVRDDAAAAVEAAHARQVAVLVELNTTRSAEQLAALFGLRVKRVRQLLRDHRQQHPRPQNTRPPSTSRPDTRSGQQPGTAGPGQPTDAVAPARGGEPPAPPAAGLGPPHTAGPAAQPDLSTVAGPGSPNTPDSPATGDPPPQP